MADLDPALVEQAAKALYAEAVNASMDFDHWPEWDSDDNAARESFRADAREVLLAVAPAIEANALRAAADWLDEFRPFPGEETDSLRERADQINPKEDPDD